jgi:hypothetical protein
MAQHLLNYLASWRTDQMAATRLDVLTTPLMTFLARTAYSETDANPSHLLAAEYDDPVKLEDHLLGSLIPAVYRPETRPPWNAQQIQRWLAFLAVHIGTLGTRDIAWWQLNQAIPNVLRRMTALAVGLVGGLTVTIVGHAYGHMGALGAELIGGGVGLIVGLRPQRWGAGEPRAVQRLTMRRFAAWFIGWLGYGLWLGVIALRSGPLDRLEFALGFGLIGGFVGGFGLARSGEIDPGLIIGPAATLRADIGAVLKVWLVIGMGFVLGHGLVFTGSLSLGLGFGLTYMLGLGFIFGFSDPASARFVLTCGWLALRRTMPRRTLTFLNDANSRGVLRRAGSVYQFRHDRLRQYLVDNSAQARHGRPLSQN